MIVLKDIYLKDFMNIKELSLQFDNNAITQITGKNGSGKSTLIYAIAFALTEYRKGESYRDYIRNGLEEARVILNAELNGFPINYDIEIRAKGNPIKKKVTYKDVTYLNSNYKQFSKEYDIEFFEDLMFLFQNDNSIIDAKPSDRAIILKKLFKFEFNDIVNSFRKKEEEDNFKNIETTTLLNELKSRKYELRPLVREILPTLIKDWESKVKLIDNDLSKIGNFEYEDYSTEYSSLLSNINKIQAQVSKDKIEIHDLENEIESAEKNDYENNLKLERDHKEKIQTQIDSQIKSINKEDSEIKSLQSDKRLYNFQISKLKEQIEKGLEGVCHACGQAISKDHVEGLKKELKKQESNLSNIVTKENLHLHTKESYQLAMSNMKKDLDACSNSIEEYAKKLNKLENNKKDLIYKRNAFDRSKQYLDSLLEKEKIYKKLIEQNESTKEIYERKEDLLREKQNLQNKILEARDITIANKEKRESNKLIEEEKKNRDTKVDELSIKLNNILTDANNIKTCIDIFENLFPNFILLKACEQLESYINSIIQRVFPTMRVKLRQNRSGVSFFYRFDEDSEELPVCMASGAQKTMLSLAYKVALAKLAGVQCLILDEIDASMSETNSRLVYDFLINLNGFTQIIFVTHKVSVKSYILENNRDKAIVFYDVEDGNYTRVE